MGLSLPHLIVLALIVLLLFGRGKISEMMGDFGKGIKSFKEGVADETNRPAAPQVQLNPLPPQPVMVTVHPAPLQPQSPPVTPAQPTLNGEPVPEQAPR